jgi:ADP-heptose:LPS heptosyltransferase
MLREGYTPPNTHFSIISGRGGLGDQLARIPAYKHMLETYPHVSATIYVQDYFYSLAQFLYNHPRMTYKRLSEAPYTMSWPRIEFNMERLTTLHMHLTDHAFMILMDQPPPRSADRFYPLAPLVPLTSPWDPEPFVVFTTDYTAPTRQWPSYHVNKLATMCAERGVTPVLLGKSDPIDTGVPGDPVRPQSNQGLKKDLFYDLRDKTTLVEALGVMQRARAVVGVDNGLLHLCGYTTTPMVVGYTSLLAKHRLPARESGLTEVLEAQVPCGGCQSRGFAVNVDWRSCLFDDYACTLTLTADRFLAALEKMKVFA